MALNTLAQIIREFVMDCQINLKNSIRNLIYNLLRKYVKEISLQRISIYNSTCTKAEATPKTIEKKNYNAETNL